MRFIISTSTTKFYDSIDKTPNDLITNHLYGILRFYRRAGKVRERGALHP